MCAAMRHKPSEPYVRVIIKNSNKIKIFFFFFFIWRDSTQWTMTTSFTRFLDHTHRRTTVGRTPLDE